MILEYELLEQIADDERDFAFALQIFDSDLVRLKSALLWQVNDELIEIRRAGEVRKLSISELKAIWCDDDNFLDTKRATQFLIRLTDAGQKRAFS